MLVEHRCHLVDVYDHVGQQNLGEGLRLFLQLLLPDIDVNTFQIVDGLTERAILTLHPVTPVGFMDPFQELTCASEAAAGRCFFFLLGLLLLCGSLPWW